MLGISNHDIVVIDSEIKAKINKSKPHKVYKFKDASWNDIREDARILNEQLLEDLKEVGKDKCWDNFKEGMDKIMEKHIPSKSHLLDITCHG